MDNEWISVEERLPDPGEPVLVYTPPQPDDWPDCHRVDFDHIDEDSGLWYEHAEHYEHFCCAALPEGSTGPKEQAPYTHWMPIPAPPQ